MSHESLPLQVREDGDSRVDQLAGTISVVEHVAKIDDVEHVDAQISQVVVHRSDQLVGRCRFEHRSIGPAPCADLGDDDEIIRIWMERLANQLVRDVWAIVIAGVDVVHSGCHGFTQHGQCSAPIRRRSEYVGARQVHGTVAEPPHVGTLFRGQEQCDVRHFLGPAETSKQRLAEHRARPFGVFQLFSRLIGFDQARGDGIRANTVFAPLHRELPRHSDDPCLGRRMRQGAKRLEAQKGVQGRRVHDHAVAGLQMRPRRTREEEHQIDFFPQIAVPLLVRDVFEPVEVRHRGVVEQHVDPPVLVDGEIDQSLALGGLGQVAWLKGDHRSALGADHFSCGFSRGGVHVATDDRRTLSSECHGGRSADAAAGAGDDADFS